MEGISYYLEKGLYLNAKYIHVIFSQDIFSIWSMSQCLIVRGVSSIYEVWSENNHYFKTSAWFLHFFSVTLVYVCVIYVDNISHFWLSVVVGFWCPLRLFTIRKKKVAGNVDISFSSCQTETTSHAHRLEDVDDV